MKTDAEIKELINKVFKNKPATEKEKLAELLSPKNRLQSLRNIITSQKNMLDMMEPLAISDAKKIKGSKRSRKFKQRIAIEALKMIFKQKPNMKKTLGGVWNKFYLLKNKDIYDPLTGEKSRVYTKSETLFIERENLKKPLEYKKRSLQRFIDALK